MLSGSSRATTPGPVGKRVPSTSRPPTCRNSSVPMPWV
ncbi:Uncharacterised protein [Bordetella pertussis]|nr:Uncharacterised protein [Bordetella pertussis]